LLFKRFAPRDNVSARHRAKIFRSLDADKAHERSYVLPIRALRVFVRQICKPYRFRRHIGQALEFDFREQPLSVGRDRKIGIAAFLIPGTPLKTLTLLSMIK
jgi:hypothetical protein